MEKAVQSTILLGLFLICVPMARVEANETYRKDTMSVRQQAANQIAACISQYKNPAVCIRAYNTLIKSIPRLCATSRLTRRNSVA